MKVKLFLLCAIGQLSLLQSMEAQDYLEEIQAYRLELHNATNPVVQAEILNDIGFAFRRYSVDSLLKYGNLALELAIENNDLRNQAYAYKNIGIAFYKKGEDHEIAIENYKKAMNIAEKIEDYNLKAGCLNNIGLVYNTIFQLENSIQIYLQGLQLYEDGLLEEDFRKGLLLSNLSTSYRELDKHDKSLYYLKKALDFAEKNGYEKLITIYCDDYAMGLLGNGQPELAAEKCKECLEIMAANNDVHSNIQALYTYAEIMFSLANYEEAQLYAIKAYRLAEKDKFMVISAKCLLVCAKASDQLGDVHGAIGKGIKAYNTSTESDKLWQSAQIALFLTQKYREIGDHETALNYYEAFV